MKRAVCLSVLAIAIVVFSLPAAADEITFDPNTQWYTMNSQGVLSLWGVPEANGNALVANPDYGWPPEMAVASWLSTILKAQEMNLVVTVGYDPVTFDIWYVGKPH